MPRRPSITAAMRARLRRWALRRQGSDALPLRLAARRVYILPTPAGWMFAMLLAVLFVAGMNYGNGLALLFTFWLTGFALVAMVQTQRGLAGTRVLEAVALPAHAGGAVELRLRVAGRHPAEDLVLEADDDVGNDAPVSASRVAGDSGELVVHLTAARRGPWRAPALQLASTAPFALFRTWTWLQLDVNTLVYPAVAGARAVPETAGEGVGHVRHTHGLDELAWLRDFRTGDSPRQVAWKAYARGQPLLVREYQGEGALHREFDFAALAGLDTEGRLCQLTRWVVEAHARGESWVLRLPLVPPLVGAGTQHRDDCLARLALHGHAGKLP